MVVVLSPIGASIASYPPRQGRQSRLCLKELLSPANCQDLWMSLAQSHLRPSLVDHTYSSCHCPAPQVDNNLLPPLFLSSAPDVLQGFN